MLMSGLRGCCHSGDTSTPLYHVAPRLKGQPAKLSPFLANIEIPRRRQELEALVCP